MDGVSLPPTNPISLGAGALGALETITGGQAGPSSAGLNAANNLNFNHGEVNFGSKNGVPTWAIFAALAIGGVYVLKQVK